MYTIFLSFWYKIKCTTCKEKKTQDWRHNCEGWFYHRNFFWRIKFHWKSKHEYIVTCFIASFKKTFEWIIELKKKPQNTLLLVQLLAIHKIGSTLQTFSHIISFWGSFRWKNWLNQSRNFPSRTVIKFCSSPKMTNSGKTDARLSSVDCAIGLSECPAISTLINTNLIDQDRSSPLYCIY